MADTLVEGGDATVQDAGEEAPNAFQASVERFYLALMDVQAGQRSALDRVLNELAIMKAELHAGEHRVAEVSRLALGWSSTPAGDWWRNGAFTASFQGSVELEMLGDCERKAGQAILDMLRTATSASAPDPQAALFLFSECVRLGHESKVCGCIAVGLSAVACTCRLLLCTCLTLNPQAANIYGGFLLRGLQEATDDALRELEALRSLRRLQLGRSDGDEVRSAHKASEERAPTEK
jgi:hypothetical protein